MEVVPSGDNQLNYRDLSSHGRIELQSIIHQIRIDVGDVITLQDNTSPTLTLGTDNQGQEWNTELTANRTITLALSGGDYQRFTIYRTGGGAFTLDVGGIKTIPASINAVVEVEYRSSAWHLINFYTL